MMFATIMIICMFAAGLGLSLMILILLAVRSRSERDPAAAPASGGPAAGGTDGRTGHRNAIPDADADAARLAAIERNVWSATPMASEIWVSLARPTVLEGEDAPAFSISFARKAAEGSRKDPTCDMKLAARAAAAAFVHGIEGPLLVVSMRLPGERPRTAFVMVRPFPEDPASDGAFAKMLASGLRGLAGPAWPASS